MLRSVFLRTVAVPIEATSPTPALSVPLSSTGGEGKAKGAEHTLCTLSVFRGPDWCLQELQDAAGATIRSWSYAIDKQGALETPAGSILHLQVTQRGRDWVGDCLLETGQYPCTLRKENEKGVVLQFGGWEQILWYGDGGWSEARTWALATAGATAVVASAVRPSAVVSADHRPHKSYTDHSRHSHHSGHGGYRSRPSASASAPAASASAICKIRLTGS
jgi:hypothetical protein